MSEQIEMDIILEEQEVQELELNVNHWYPQNY